MSVCPKCESNELSVEVTAFAVVPAVPLEDGGVELLDGIGPYIDDREYGAFICHGCDHTWYTR